jgi:hypothetical protein
MDRLSSRNNPDIRRLDEDDWTMVGWQDRRLQGSSAMHGRDGKGISNADTIIGAVYLGLFIVFIFVFLT